jgi:hypothetical protein
MVRASWGLGKSARMMSDGTSALASSLWIAICCAAPEFIWQGLKIAVGHTGWPELFSALLIGVILAFFVEPIMERIRALVGASAHGAAEPHHALFTVALSLAFALASVCLHDAITAFVSGHGSGPSASDAALTDGITLVVEWAFVPFAVTLTWLSVGNRWLRVPIGIFGGVSSLLGGWLFGWPLHSVFTTTCPCLTILVLGYRRRVQEPDDHRFAKYAGLVATVATIWLACALLFDAALAFCKADYPSLYDAIDFWADVRFYIGWVLGLVLAPWPYHRIRGAID